MAHLRLHTTLLEDGPIVEGEIFADEESFLKQKNFGTPETFASVRLLIDTGSNISGLDFSLIKLLSLPPLNQTDEWVQGVNENWQAKRFGCILYLPIFEQKALTIEILGGNYPNNRFHGIIGRDVLQYCNFEYDGIRNDFTLTAKGF